MKGVNVMLDFVAAVAVIAWLLILACDRARLRDPWDRVLPVLVALVAAAVIARAVWLV
jgi:hypothetical protein